MDKLKTTKLKCKHKTFGAKLWKIIEKKDNFLSIYFPFFKNLVK